MTRKKAVKVRDTDKTRHLLLQATSEIVREQGFGGLNASAVARRAGRHNTAVARIFESLTGLKRAYIDRKDYWGTFFAQFVPKDDSPAGMKLLFTELMQDNLKSFWADGEMQRLIHWQMGEPCKVMRSVSDQREHQGDRLLKMTDSFFAGSGTSFRAVTALLLYGTYGVALHARNNGSTVCGLDINNERDRQLLHRTITQVLDWSWEAADRDGRVNKKLSKLIMNYEFETLETLAAERAPMDVPEADQRIAAEVTRLKKLIRQHLISLQNETQLRTYLQINLHTLVLICDRLTVAGRAHNPDAELVLNLLDSVRQDMSEYIPDNLSVPMLLVYKETAEFDRKWKATEAKLLDAGVSPELVRLAGIPFNRFVPDGRVQWAAYRYLRVYVRALNNVLRSKARLNDEKLIAGLMELGFNSVRFMAWYTGHILEEMDGLGSLERAKVLNRHRSRILRWQPLPGRRYNRYRRPVDDELLTWLSAQHDKLFSEEEQRLLVKELMADVRQWLKMQY